jgi:phage protein D
VSTAELRLEIDGRRADDLLNSLQRLDVDLDLDLAGAFRFTLAAGPGPDQPFADLDDDRLAPWRSVTVSGGPSGATRRLLTGYLTGGTTHVDPGGQWRLTVWGLDSSVLLDRRDITRAWPNLSDSAIAKEVLEAHHLRARVTDTRVVHGERVSTVVQRETDMHFLRRLAARNDYECVIDGDTGWFRPIEIPPACTAPALVVAPRSAANVTRLDVEVDALRPVDVEATQLERVEGTVLRTLTTASASGPALGARRVESYLPDGVKPALVRPRHAVAVGAADAAALCRGLADRARWFVTASGELDGSRYDAVLLPRDRVEVRGAGRSASGDYLVARVRHGFTRAGYRQQFELRRDALAKPAASGPSGSTRPMEA